MAQTTFSGPVKSLAGFITAGVNSSVSLSSDTTLTVAAHAGKIILLNDADGKFTLPSIVSTTPDDPTSPSQTNNIGASFFFYVETLATDLDIKTDGTDKFVGAVIVAIDDSTKKAFVPAASNDVITLNGTTKGGIVGSVIKVTAIDSATYLVHDSLLIGSGTIVTPFADA
jgi:hypothetical protein